MAGETAILKKLSALESEIRHMKRNMVNIDEVLTQDDEEALKEAGKDLRRAKTQRL